MLNSLRKGAATWIAKIFIGLLVISFAVWGVADIFGGYGGRNVAKVGEREISGEEYQFALRTQLAAFGRQFGRTLTMEEGRALGVDRQVLQRMIGEAALEATATNYNLGVSDKAIVDRIKSETIFKDAAGRFNEQIFRSILHTNNMTEQTYVARQRLASVRRQLTQTITDTVPLPKTLLAATDLYRNEKRTLSYFVLPEAKLGTIEEPTEEKLRAYYDANKRNFMAPEYRKLGLLPVTQDFIGDKIEITDEDVTKYYNDHNDQYRTAERRQILQISYPDKAAAEAAAQKIKGGQDFLEAAKEAGFKESDIDLGMVAKTGLSDQDIAKAAFALAKDEVSAPVKGSLATVLLKVTEIEPEVVRSLEDAKADVRKAILTDRAGEEILNYSDKIEEERAAGTPLTEIANKLNLKYVEIEAVDNNGNDAKGVAVSPLPGGASLLRDAFASEVNAENDPVETQDRGLIWSMVLDVTPTRQKTFEEVKDAVTTAWREAEVRKLLSAKGQELIDKAKGGTPLKEVAEGLELELKESEPLTRSQSADDLPNTVIAQGFALSEGGYGSAPSDDGKSRVIFKVAKITAPEPLTADTEKTLRESLATSRADDFANQYVGGLRTDLGVTINQILFDELTGRRFAEPGRGSF